ncbi:MAG: HEAT repeat domain-containing protein [Candidatus Aminicenantaceae bacterium]
MINYKYYRRRRIARRTNIKEMKANRDIEGLIRLLPRNDAEISKKAAEALGDLKDKRAVEPLIETLKNKYVQDEAIEAFVKIQNKREAIIEALVKIKEQLNISLELWKIKIFKSKHQRLLGK